MNRALIFLATLGAVALVTGCSGGSNGSDGATGPAGPSGPAGPTGPAGGDPVTSVEACIGCHGQNGVLPVGDVTNVDDPHYIDTNPLGPETDSGYRRLNPVITQVDVRGSSVIIDFDVFDENMNPVDNIFASDGRFTIARLTAGTAAEGFVNNWLNLIDILGGTSERFTVSSGVFENFMNGSYRYTSGFDPTSVPVVAGDTLRVGIQLSASDLPHGHNGWCDFDADLVNPNDCVSGTSVTRDIVQTATCNGCHGATSDVWLAMHGGGRTEVEFCVTCHNPGRPEVDFKVMIHKIHRGANLSMPYMIGNTDFSNIQFTKDIDNCTVCHKGGGLDVDNWKARPSMEACGSCHDDVDFVTGANHGGGPQADNKDCLGCHFPGSFNGADVKHRGVQREAEADTYTGGSNGYAIENLSFDSATDMLTVDFSVTKNGSKMNLTAAPGPWAPANGGASRLAILVGWSTSDYTNVGSGSPPALPISINGLDIGGAVTDLGGGVYRVVADLGGTEAADTITVAMEGHPAADLDGDGSYTDRIAVKNVFQDINLDGGRATQVARRQVVDVNKCNKCHDAAGQGISLHGNNRTGQPQVCVICHNPNDTDVNRRPVGAPAGTLDNKAEVSIDFKRMIHEIHSGAELETGLVVYGFGGSPNDFGTVEFIGNRQNCETCHLPGTYEAEDALEALASTIDTGADKADPSDDLNISSTAAVCSSCHDDGVAENHMKLNGASFMVKDADVL